MSYIAQDGKRRSIRRMDTPAIKAAYALRMKPLLEAYGTAGSAAMKNYAVQAFLEALYEDPHTELVLGLNPAFRATTVQKCKEFQEAKGAGAALRLLCRAIQERFGL